MHVVLRVLQTAKTIEKAAKVLFGRCGLTPAHFNVLNLLINAPRGLRSADLARELLVDPSNVTGLLRRMTRGGYIVETANKSDRRSRLVRLTPKGERAWREAAKIYKQRLADVTALIGAADSAKAGKVLSQIRAALELQEDALS